MSRLTLTALAAAAFFLTAPAAFAQTPPDAEAMEAASVQLNADIGAMRAELEAAKTAAAGDDAAWVAASDEIVTRYQPRMNAFADLAQAFIQTPEAGVPAEEFDAAWAGVNRVRNAPNEIRATIAAE